MYFSLPRLSWANRPRVAQSRTLSSGRPLALALVIGLGASGGTTCTALQPATPLSRLSRQAWSMENGLPQNTVPVLLQSRSGFLWAGTELGLARFDGTSFRIFDHTTVAAFPDAEIRCLLDSTDGSLWIGTGDGLVRWQNGRSVLLTKSEGLPSNSIRGIVQTSDGNLWVWTEQGLAELSSSPKLDSSQARSPQFRTVSSETGLPDATITSLAADASGGLWLGTTAGPAVRRGGVWRPVLEDPQHRGTLRGTSLVSAEANGDVMVAATEGVFLEANGQLVVVLPKTARPLDGVSFMARLTNGYVAVGSKSSIVLAQNGRVVGRFNTGHQLPGSRIEAIYPDREGCLWIGTNHGLARIVGGQVQLLPATDPLATAAVVSLLEDREGDLWAGTENSGLHILRDSRFRNVGAGDGLTSDATTAVVQDIRGTLWIGTREGGLNRTVPESANGRITSLTTTDGLLSDVILSLASSPDGDLWVGTPDGLNRVHGKIITNFSSADGLPDDFIRSLLVSPDNSVWIGTRRGLTHLDLNQPVASRFRNFTEKDGLGSDLVGALARTPDGDLWIATLKGLSRLHKDKLLNYTTADGLSSNVITALAVTSDRMLWIGNQEKGLNLWDGNRFSAIQDHTDQIPAAIHSILPDDRGHIWISSTTGLTRADIPPLLDCAEHAVCNINSTNFSTADWLRTRETSSNSHPTACRTRDGQLWFTTPRGVIVIDPAQFAENPPPPPVAIERFAVDDKDLDEREDTRIAAGHLRFQFDYTGLSFAAPQKLRYQYKLEGFDHNWTEAGTRRTAYYTNIPSGRYRFRVRASLSDFRSPGKVSEAELSFELLPHFYQTIWFISLLILLAAFMVWLTFRLIFRRRLRRVEREFRAVMAERNRIAREIHDTLAQGYVGISVQLEVLGELLRHNRTEAATKHLDLTQGYVREGLDDARQSIWALRSHDAGEQTLPVRIRRLVEKAQDSELSTGLEVHGAYRALTPEVEKEILRIAQEAIHNVKKHAGASRMNVRLDYDERALMLSVSDNGKGFALAKEDDTFVAAPGHFGLTGMKERADLIHGRMEIVSTPVEGTTVRLQISAPSVVVRDRNQQIQQVVPESSENTSEAISGQAKEQK